MYINYVEEETEDNFFFQQQQHQYHRSIDELMMTLYFININKISKKLHITDSKFILINIIIIIDH